MEKRGALELSVNTIVIVVLGITILIIGLAFLDTIKEKLTESAEGAFEELEGRFEELNAKEILTLIPSSFDVEAGKTKQVKVIIANLENSDYGNVVASVESVNPNEAKCLFASTQTGRSKSYNIASGKQVSLDLRVQVGKNSILGDKTCNVMISGNGITEPDTEASLFINVVK